MDVSKQFSKSVFVSNRSRRDVYATFFFFDEVTKQKQKQILELTNEIVKNESNLKKLRVAKERRLGGRFKDPFTRKSDFELSLQAH